MRLPARFPILALVLLAVVVPVAAQNPSAALELTVRTSDDAPLSGAQVLIEGLGMRGVTDQNGYVRIPNLPIGQLGVQVRYLGYASLDETLSFEAARATRILVKLTPTPIALQEINVRGRRRILETRGFYDRQRFGLGTYFTRDDINRLSPRQLSDVLRRVGGIAVRGSPFGALPTAEIRGPSSASNRCPIQYYVDGTLTVGFNIDYVMPRDVEGLEIYKGAATVPPEYNKGTARCGVILIWTRVD
jgi:hypothetical protein